MRALLLIAALLAPSPPPTPVDIRADRLELDQKAGRARFEGAVEVKQGRLTLRCATLAATYAEGEIAALTAEGEVVLTGDDWTARAARAEWDRAAGRLVLTGEPRIERGGDTLRGARVLVWPEAQRVVIEQARGRLTAPPLTAPTKPPTDPPPKAAP